MPTVSRTAGAIPKVPPDFCLESCFAGVRWHHKWELFDGCLTPGVVDVAELCRQLRLPADLAGKRVLDVGGWQGCFSFECERRGASEVVCYSLENPNASGFKRMRSLLGSRVKYVQGTADALSSRSELGQFDVVLFLGVLYHLRYPLLALDQLRAVCRGDVYVETHVIDDSLITLEAGERALPDALRSVPLWQQYKAYELHREDASNWFGPNVAAVLEGFGSAGFEIEHIVTRNQRRGLFKARVLPDVPARLQSATYESVDPHDAALTGVSRSLAHALFEPLDLPPVDGQPRDSREPAGVSGDLDVQLASPRVRLGERFLGRATAKNTGEAIWLPETAATGAVRISVQGYDADGAFIGFLPPIALRSGERPILPGEEVEVSFEIEATTPGRGQLDFDLFSQDSFQFQFRTNVPGRIRVEVL